MGGSCIGTHGAAEGFKAADRRNLGHHALHPAIVGCDLKHVAAGIARPEDSDPFSINLRWPKSKKGDRVPITAPLKDGVHLLPGLPA